MIPLDLTQPGRLYPPEEAERIASELQATDEDGWSYRAVHDPKGTGLSRVEVLDEEGEVVGRF